MVAKPAAWDWGSAWCPSCPLTPLGDSGVLAHQIGGWSTCSCLLGCRAGWLCRAAQGSQVPCCSCSTLTHQCARSSSRHGSRGPWSWPSGGGGRRCVRRTLIVPVATNSSVPLPPPTRKFPPLLPTSRLTAPPPVTVTSRLSPDPAGWVTPLASESQDNEDCVPFTALSPRPRPCLGPRSCLLKEEVLSAPSPSEDTH